MSLRIPLAAAVAAAFLTFAPPALAVGTSSVSSPSDGATFSYDASAPSTVAVAGTATGMASVDVVCADSFEGSWEFSSPLTGGSDVPVASGAFSAASVELPTDTNPLCRLVAVPHGTTPTDLTGLSGPALRLLVHYPLLHNRGGTTNEGKQYDFLGTSSGTTADDYVDTPGNDGGGLDMELTNADPGELGDVFSEADRILELDPNAPSPGSGAEVPTGLLVDDVNAFTGPAWEALITPSLNLVFRDMTPFPTVSVRRGQAADGSFTLTEHDLVSRCAASDPMFYPPAGFTCSSLADAGVAIDIATKISPAGNVVDRSWSLSSTDGRAHSVKAWLGHVAGSNSLPRAWKLPGDAGYATRRFGDAPAAAGAAPWIARFNSVGAADGDTSEGVGAVGVSAVPNALRFDGPRDLDALYQLAVPAIGSAQLRTVYVGDATQAALEADLAAAFPPVGGGGGGGGSGPGSAPALSRTGKALLGLTGKLSLGYALACPADAATSCTASIALTQPVRRAARRHARAHHAKQRRAARRARPRTLGTLNVTVASGGTLALTTTIARKYRAAFKAGHITMTARLGRTGVATQTVVKPLPVKIAKPKPRRRGRRRR